MKEQKKRWSKKLAREIARTSFGYVLDCLKGVSDTGYTMSTTADDFQTNFEEDIEGLGFAVTSLKMDMIEAEYDILKAKFDQHVNKFKL